MSAPITPLYNLQAVLADIAADEQGDRTAKRVLSSDEIRQIVKKRRQSPDTQPPHNPES
jgi:hypothetical protein